MPVREWSIKAEQFRQDVIALALDIKALLVEQEYAQDAGDMVRVAYIRKQIYDKIQKLHHYAKEVKR